MQSRTTPPTLFINVFLFNGVEKPLEQAVVTNRAEAVRDAEEFAEQYLYTLTDIGKLDLSSEFSEGWQEKRDFDAAVDRKIDEMKAERHSREMA